MSSHENEFDAVVVARAHTADSIDVFELARADASALPAWQPGAHPTSYCRRVRSASTRFCGTRCTTRCTTRVDRGLPSRWLMRSER